jgi:hypothetical protein
MPSKLSQATVKGNYSETGVEIAVCKGGRVQTITVGFCKWDYV